MIGEKLDRVEAVAILREILEVWGESVIMTCVSIDDPSSRISRNSNNGYEIRLRCSLDNDSRDCIKPILEKYKVGMKDEEGFVIIYSPLLL